MAIRRYRSDTPPTPIAETRRASRVRLASVALGASGILLALYPWIRPFPSGATIRGAAALASSAWVVAYVLSMVGLILLAIGLLGLWLTLRETAAERLAFEALVLSWLGVGLTLPYYGAKAFGLGAVGREALVRNDSSLAAVASLVRSGPWFVMVVAGLVLLGIAAILVDKAIRRSRLLPSWSGLVFAIAFALYIPQYVAAQPVRDAHGLLMAVGCISVAVGMWRHSHG